MGDAEPVRFIAADGSATAEDRYRHDVPAETLAWLYENLVLTRDLDTEFVNLQRQGELALYASCRGQRPPRSVPPRACARQTGSFRNTANSAHSWCAGLPRPDGGRVARFLARGIAFHP